MWYKILKLVYELRKTTAGQYALFAGVAADGFDIDKRLPEKFGKSALGWQMKASSDFLTWHACKIVGRVYSAVFERACHSAPDTPDVSYRHQPKCFFPLSVVCYDATFIIGRVFFCESAGKFGESLSRGNAKTYVKSCVLPHFAAKGLAPFL